MKPHGFSQGRRLAFTLTLIGAGGFARQSLAQEANDDEAEGQDFALTCQVDLGGDFFMYTPEGESVTHYACSVPQEGGGSRIVECLMDPFGPGSEDVCFELEPIQAPPG